MTAKTRKMEAAERRDFKHTAVEEAPSTGKKKKVKKLILLEYTLKDDYVDAVWPMRMIPGEWAVYKRYRTIKDAEQGLVVAQKSWYGRPYNFRIREETA